MFNINNISSAQLGDWVENRKIHLIDVRTPNEVKQGAIDGNIPIPLHLVPLELDRLRTMKGDIVVYCRTGARSAQACGFLTTNGLGNVFNLEGGIMNWVRSGNAIIR